MITVQTIDLITSTIALVAVYVISVTLCGAGQTIINRYIGDDTAEQAGFLTLNPFQHIDIIGALALLFVGLGWGRMIPLDPNKIYGQFRTPRLIILYGGQTIIHLFLAILALVSLVALFGFTTAKLALISSLHSDLYAHYSSLTIACALFLSAGVLLNLFLATWDLIIDTFRYIMFIGFENNYTYVQYANFLAFFGPFLVMLLWAPTINRILLNISMYCAYFIAKVLGIL